MSLNDSFNPAASSAKDHKSRAKRLPPFSLRLSADERALLMNEAAGAPLGAYIETKLLGAAVPVRMRRTGLAVEDRAALAQVLALLGRSRLRADAQAATQARAMLDANPSGSLGHAMLNDDDAIDQSGLL